jgi:hypothetical protein
VVTGLSILSRGPGPGPPGPTRSESRVAAFANVSLLSSLRVRVKVIGAQVTASQSRSVRMPVIRPGQAHLAVRRGGSTSAGLGQAAAACQKAARGDLPF